MASKNENPNDKELSRAQVDTTFASMMGNLAVSDPDFVEEVTHIRPSIAQQQERFSSVRAEYYKQWQEAGILEVVADRVVRAKDGDKFLGGADVRFQRHINKRNDGTQAEEWQLVIDRSSTEVSKDGKSTTVRSSIARLPIARIENDVLIPAADFTYDQAEIIQDQVAVLDELRNDDMGLPNLAWNLDSIFDPSTALTRYDPPASDR